MTPYNNILINKGSILVFAKQMRREQEAILEAHTNDEDPETIRESYGVLRGINRIIELIERRKGDYTIGADPFEG